MKKHLLSYEEISQLCLELSLFMHAGTDIGSGLYLLSDEVDTPWLKSILCEIAKDIDKGMTISASFEKSKLFPNDVIAMLKVGERTGRTEQTLKALAKDYRQKQIQDTKIKNTLTYPSVLLLIMLAVIVTLLTRILPIFRDVYASHGGSITGVAGVLLSVGDFLNKALPLLVIIMLFAVLFVFAFAFSERFRKKLFFESNKKFKGLTKSITSARFASALAMGLASGLASDEAVKNAALLLNDIPMAKKHCDKCTKLLESGCSLSESLSTAELLPSAECRLLAIGVASGSGETVAEEIAARLERAADDETERKIGMIEPLIVTVTSVLVGLILLSVMLPLTNIMSSMG